MIKGTLLSHRQVYQSSPKLSQGYEAILSIYVGGGVKKCLTLPILACTINWHLLQLVVGHTVIIVGYVIRVGTSLSLVAHGEFVGEQSHEAEMENL